MLFIGLGDYTTAERWLRQALERYGAMQDSLSDGYGRTIGNLGLVLLTRGRPAEAEPFLRASARQRWRFDSTSAANAVLLGNLAAALSQQGKLDSAEPVYRAALAGFDRLRPREFFEKGFTLGNLAVDFINRGRAAEAPALARAQIAHFSSLLGPTHPNVGYGWVNLARALHATGAEQPAFDAAHNAETIFRSAGFAPDHPDFARTELIKGQVLTSLGRFPEAERRLRNALAIRRARLAPGSDRIADAEAALGGLLLHTRRYAEAETLLVAAFRVYRGGSSGGDLRAERAVGSLLELCGAGIRTACSYRDSLSRGSRSPQGL